MVILVIKLTDIHKIAYNYHLVGFQKDQLILLDFPVGIGITVGLLSHFFMDLMV